MAQTGRALAQRFQIWAGMRTLRFRMVLGFGFGALAALGQAPFDLWPLALLGLAGLLTLHQGAKTWRHAAWIGWAGGFGYFAVALHWIVEPFLVDIARHGWMAPFALVLLAGGLALFWALACGSAQRLAPGSAGWILAMALAELLRSYVFTGFPWGLIGHLWIPTAMAQWAAWGGAHGLTLLALTAAAALDALAAGRWWRGGGMVAALAACFGIGIFWSSAPELNPNAPVLRLVQPNAPQHQKWDPTHIPTFFRRQIDATGAMPRPDLVIWPETALPVYLDGAEDTLRVMAEAAQGTPIVFGVMRSEGLRLYNSAAVLDSAGRAAQVYDKHHLVPFGEYMPLGDMLARFGIHGLAANQGAGFSAGPGPRLLDLGHLGKALPLICYEAVFPQDVGGTEERPGFLMQLTNDAWFGQFSGPYQHLAQAQLRAIEQGLPMVRVANTGISAVIDAKGHVLHQLPLGQSGWLDSPLPRAGNPTFYGRTGDIIVAVSILLLFCAVIGIAAKEHRSNAD